MPVSGPHLTPALSPRGEGETPSLAGASQRRNGTPAQPVRTWKNVFYFMGVDVAPAMTKGADDGALVVGRARPRMDHSASSVHGPPSPRPSPQGEGAILTSNPTDWIFEYVWAYRLRKASAREWSGFVHAKHLQFNFTRIGLDPQGGGYWVMNEMNKSRQLIQQIETECVPIVSYSEEGVVNGYFILTLMKPSDTGIRQLWPLIGHSDTMTDAMHVVMQQAVEHAGVIFPPAHDSVPREVSGQWSVEKQWASKALSAVVSQLSNIEVAVKDDGQWDMTVRNARRFSAKGKKDLAYAAIYAYVAFLVWLKMSNGEFDVEGEGEGMFSVM